MPKKVFDPNKLKNSGSSNIECRIPNYEYRITNVESVFDINVSFDNETLICGNFLDAYEGF